ncbi:MAG: hypothetical protein GOMPHAMPRED_007054 [Gomphillus americanus]|uniref:mitogen-activated protein kinase n=1 Tax=Gomphillus americanus TaxID=1940652 RepID=A0A8H3EWX4_9LECA|nr:MAG: hypothetical protein GOMPHAMPRED_007054 [Gomphillus americanus]
MNPAGASNNAGNTGDSTKLYHQATSLASVMEAPEETPRPDSDSSASPDEFSAHQVQPLGGHEPGYYDPSAQIVYTPATTLDGFPPTKWTSYTPTQHPQPSRKGSGVLATSYETGQILTNGLASPRPLRPSIPSRQPSSTYNPQRVPPHFIAINGKHRSSSSSKRERLSEAQYRAQEKPYVSRLIQVENHEYFNEPSTPSLGGYSSMSEDEDESPNVEAVFDNEYDQDVQLFYNTDDLQPSAEEMQNPGNRERLEWHNMLASVLRGDVVKQEKQRLIGVTDQKADKAYRNELWLWVRARACGRSTMAQQRLIDESRSSLHLGIESIIKFQIKGVTEVGKTASEQVQEIVEKLDKFESYYPSRAAFEAAYQRAASEEFRESSETLLSWHNTTLLINTQLNVLKQWVGNDELDLSRSRARSPSGTGLSDESSLLDRMLKEEALKSLGDRSPGALFYPLKQVIEYAKLSLVQNAEAFAQRHLPPFTEDLLTLISFPTRLVQEIIRMRVKYAKNMKDLSQQGNVMIEQVLQQFKSLVDLAYEMKKECFKFAQPEPGWDPPPCIDENYDETVVDAIRQYFKLINSQLVMNKNAFRETEILEIEWDWCNKNISNRFEGSDVGLAEQFCSLTSKSLQRLTLSFDRELHRKSEGGQDQEKRYRQLLDTVRIKQLKLFRFSRVLYSTFENATEYNINLPRGELQELYSALVSTNHFLVQPLEGGQDGIYIIAHSSLYTRPALIQSILEKPYIVDIIPGDPIEPYVLVLHHDEAIQWDGNRLDVALSGNTMETRSGRLRLIADGALQRLSNARLQFLELIGMNLDTVSEARAHLPRVNAELAKIKRTTGKLSTAIMDSVDIIRKQTQGQDNQEMIHACYVFATEFGKRSRSNMSSNQRLLSNIRLTKLALDWISFICDECIASDRKTFKWAVVALEFAMMMTRGPNVLAISDEEFTKFRVKVAGCMSLLISHFDIMGARSNLAAQAERQRLEALAGQIRKMDLSKMKSDAEAMEATRAALWEKLVKIDAGVKEKEAERRSLGRVLEETNEADRSLTYLSAAANQLNLRWQQGAYVGGGTFGSVYQALNLDSGQLMAVKEIRLQDPQLIPTIAQAIRDEMAVLEVLDHPNIVDYYGIEVHRDKVCIFMEFCSGGSLATLLEHGRIEDETVIQVYALQLLEGLAYLHTSHIIHRDIKPENILLDHLGIIKYVDFGAAKIIARKGKTVAADPSGHGGPQARAPGKQKSMTGTPMYMSPEVIRGQNEGHQGAVDVWSLGCVVLEMASGRRPWASLDNEWAIMYNIAQGNPPALPTSDQLSPEGLNFLRRCFERDPRHRATAAELLQTRWIMQIREEMELGVDMEIQTPSSESSSNAVSRQSSGSDV